MDPFDHDTLVKYNLIRSQLEELKEERKLLKKEKAIWDAKAKEIYKRDFLPALTDFSSQPKQPNKKIKSKTKIVSLDKPGSSSSSSSAEGGGGEEPGVKLEFSTSSNPQTLNRNSIVPGLAHFFLQSKLVTTSKKDALARARAVAKTIVQSLPFTYSWEIQIDRPTKRKTTRAALAKRGIITTNNQEESSSDEDEYENDEKEEKGNHPPKKKKMNKRKRSRRSVPSLTEEELFKDAKDKLENLIKKDGLDDHDHHDEEDKEWLIM